MKFTSKDLMKNLIEEIEKLKNNKKAFSERGYSDNECYAYRSAIKDTLSILNQYNIITAPKKPIYENDLVDENVVVNTWAYCPNCKEELDHDRWGEEYCSNCGQRLDWSD